MRLFPGSHISLLGPARSRARFRLGNPAPWSHKCPVTSPGYLRTNWQGSLLETTELWVCTKTAGLFSNFYEKRQRFWRPFPRGISFESTAVASDDTACTGQRSGVRKLLNRTHTRTHTLTHAHTHTHFSLTCTHPHALSHTRVRTHMHTLTHMHSHTCTCACTHICSLTHMHSHMCTLTRTCALTRTCTLTRTCARTHMHTLTRVCVHMHTLCHMCTLTRALICTCALTHTQRRHSGLCQFSSRVTLRWRELGNCTLSTVSEQQRAPWQSQENCVYTAGKPLQVLPEWRLESFPSRSE